MIKKDLGLQNTSIKNKNFPMITHSKKGAKRSLLGIGGNIGDVMRRFDRLLVYLRHSSLVRVIETSIILQNPPFGYTNQDDFYNALMLIETRLTPNELLAYILRVERIFGRKRSFANAPRTLDIDIIFYEGVKMSSDRLTIPHIGYKDRDSVLIPLESMRYRV